MISRRDPEGSRPGPYPNPAIDDMLATSSPAPQSAAKSPNPCTVRTRGCRPLKRRFASQSCHYATQPPSSSLSPPSAPEGMWGFRHGSSFSSLVAAARIGLQSVTGPRRVQVALASQYLDLGVYWVSRRPHHVRWPWILRESCSETGRVSVSHTDGSATWRSVVSTGTTRGENLWWEIWIERALGIDHFSLELFRALLL